MFKYPFGKSLKITVSGESGTVKGRAEYIKSPNSYLLRYKGADGRAMEQWIDEDDLSEAGDKIGIGMVFAPAMAITANDKEIKNEIHECQNHGFKELIKEFIKPLNSTTIPSSICNCNACRSARAIFGDKNE